MPAQRSSQPNSGGTKSTREKTGCYTCRIRRKKCDEMITLESNVHSCATCRRLRIECLGGFGEKRPKGLKNRQLIKQARDLIKEYLNNIGLVKGIPRPMVLTHGGPDILVLSEFLNSGELPFPMDRGSPVSESDTSSGEDNTQWSAALDAQHWPAEQEYDVSFGGFDMLGAVLQPELASSTLDQWFIYQQAQAHFMP